MKITGQILKEQRESKGISVNEISVATKIPHRTILAMENGEVDKLPPKTFLRGFVRAYATYLDLDVEKLLTTFFQEMGSTNPQQPAGDASSATPNAGDVSSGGGSPRLTKNSPNAADQAINPKTSTTKTLTVVVGILLLVIVIVFLKNKMESYEKEAVVEKNPSGIESLPSPSPSASSSPGASATPSATPPRSSIAAAIMATPSATATPVPTPVPTATPTPAPKPTPTPKPSATPKPSPSPKPSPKPSPSPKESATPKPSPSPSADKGKAQEVMLEALNEVEVKAKIDGEEKTITMKADQVQTFKAKHKVILDLSDGGAVNLIVNGRDRGVPGDLGKPKHVELP